MLSFARAAALALAVLLAAGCSTVKVADYAGQTPRFDLREYFSGQIVAHGIVQDRFGRVIRRMVVEMTGTWAGETGTLDENFSYSDGRKERRVWTITRRGDRYVGTASDVVGGAFARHAR